MTWRAGSFVLHKGKSEWGVGKVLNANSQELEVFFVHGGKRAFGQPAAFLDEAPVQLTDHPLLACLAPAVLNGSVRFLPLPECVRYFRKLFPDGFYDPAYVTTDPKRGERHYKVLASQLAQSLLRQSVWSDLTKAGQFSEICQRLGSVESKTNLLHSFEKIKWHAALKDERLQKPLAEALYNDLYGSSSRMSRFDELAKVLSQADGCAKWTTATYYGFLLQPEPRIFLKPEVTKFAAEACGWDLQYESALNWKTLSRAEALANYLFTELTRMGLKPRDLVDVQSFIWCIGPNSYS